MIRGQPIPSGPERKMKAGGLKRFFQSGNLSLTAGASILFLFAFVAVFADFFAPYNPTEQDRSMPSAPASRIRFFDSNNRLHLRPFVYRMRLANPLFLRYEEATDSPVPIGFFVHGFQYRIFGFFETNLHLFGAADGNANVYLLGSDRLGRDRFSRLIYAIQYSLIAAPIGTLLASLIGIMIGLISGFSPRSIDLVLMGSADAMLSLPTLILILAARAAFPLELPPKRAIALLIVVFALVGWAEMARLCRGLVKSLRSREFVMAARAIGAHPARILLRHIAPNTAGPLITQATLMLPAFLLAEISLSFLGVGIQEPMPSLGNMLAEAADVSRLAAQPLTLLSPAVAIFTLFLGVRLIASARSKAGEII
ncbi:MAG: ABC transporter permease [Blastocatellia bacterium]